jgi:hypothetical protein
MLILVRNSAFTDRELRAIRDFAAERRFDPVYLAGIRSDEVNRYNVLPEPAYYDACTALLREADREALYEAYAFDIHPPTDDRPFFGHLFRWRQLPEVLATTGRTWQPFGGAGYLVPLALLALAILAAGLLILLPLAVQPGKARVLEGRWRLMAYFALLGLGYLSVEIPLIQRFILFLGHPTWSLSVVLFGILVFSGIGSRLSHRVPLPAALLGIPALVAGYAFGLPHVFAATLALPLWARLVASLTALAPLGLLMGIPFPSGLQSIRPGLQSIRPGLQSIRPGLQSIQPRLAATPPELGAIRPGVAQLSQESQVSWAWAVNGATSVIASIGAALVALSWGFSAVLLLGAGCYLLAMLVRPTKDSH